MRLYVGALKKHKSCHIYLKFRIVVSEFSKKARPRKILIVDNEPDIALTIKVGLDREGILSDAFTDPREALKQFRHHTEDYLLVLTDVRMPFMSGFELAKRIRETKPEANIILMTSFEIDSLEFVKVFPSTKVDGVLQKPFLMSALTNLIVSYADQSKNKV